jgi:hypothetical protein
MKLDNSIRVEYSWAINPKERQGWMVFFRRKRSAQRFLRKLEALMRECAEDLPETKGRQ